MADSTLELGGIGQRGIILIQRWRDGAPAADGIEEELAELCAARGWDALLTPDLYHLPQDHAVWDALRKVGEVAAVFGWIAPRPMSWLLQQHGIHASDARAFDLLYYEDVWSAFEALCHAGACAPGGTVGTVAELGESAGGRWYPIMDGERCVNCQHCLQFCLFGVYELDDDGSVHVAQPDNCKDGCPACARICPQSAIMFPLYGKDAAVAGAPGRFVELDAAAKRMFYTRTGQECPLCGLSGELPRAKSEGEKCAECGRETSPPQPPSPQVARGETATAPPNALDEIDNLIDQLDRLKPGS